MIKKLKEEVFEANILLVKYENDRQSLLKQQKK